MSMSDDMKLLVDCGGSGVKVRRYAQGVIDPHTHRHSPKSLAEFYQFLENVAKNDNPSAHFHVTGIAISICGEYDYVNEAVISCWAYPFLIGPLRDKLNARFGCGKVRIVNDGDAHALALKSVRRQKGLPSESAINLSLGTSVGFGVLDWKGELLHTCRGCNWEVGHWQCETRAERKEQYWALGSQGLKSLEEQYGSPKAYVYYGQRLCHFFGRDLAPVFHPKIIGLSGGIVAAHANDINEGIRRECEARSLRANGGPLDGVDIHLSRESDSVMKGLADLLDQDGRPENDPGYCTDLAKSFAEDRPCALLAVHVGQVVCAENGGNAPLVANRQTVQGDWEAFVPIKNGDGSFSLKSAVNGKYVSAMPDGRLLAQGSGVDLWEKFDLREVPGKAGVFTLWSRHTQKFVSADENEGNVLIADRDVADTWEEFCIWWAKGARDNSEPLQDSAASATKPEPEPCVSAKPAIPDYKPGVHVRGVNLGGWLVLEKWMKKSLFAGMQAKDETSWCVELGREEATRRLREHWDTWITEADFEWIAAHGFNAVRIPVGHWIFGSASGYPYHERYGSDPHPYVDGGIERLDHAFDWAEKHGLMVLVDLHCAPGCQNGFDNGGLEGVCDWWKKPEYIDFAILTLERLAERYGKRKALWGIETLNEPRWSVPDEVIQDFDRRAYEAIRKHCPPENGAVVIHDGFRGSRIKDVFGGRFNGPEFSNVVLDVHRYQCHTKDLKALDASGNVRHAKGPLSDELRDLNGNVYWTICGEWSLATGGHRSDAQRQDFFYSQVKAFENCQGFFFWSYKIESGDLSWSLRDAVEKGLNLLLPTETLEEKVKQIVVDSCHAEASRVTSSTNFVNDLWADEFDLLELGTNIEDAFGIKIINMDDRFPFGFWHYFKEQKIDTVEDLVEHLRSKGVPVYFANPQ